MRRLATLLLTVLVAVGGVALGSCPQGRCAEMQAAASGAPHAHAGAAEHHGAHGGMQHGDRAQHAAVHDCCDGEGIAGPPCCPDMEQLAQQQATPSAERISHAFQLAAAQPVSAALAAVAIGTADPPRPVPRGAPPGTLIAQHTSLLV